MTLHKTHVFAFDLKNCMRNRNYIALEIKISSKEDIAIHSFPILHTTKEAFPLILKKKQ